MELRETRKMRRYYIAPKFLYELLTLRSNTRKERSQLRSIQNKRLRAIIQHAYENVAFYHRLFDANNVKPSEIKTVDDLKRIPIVTKKQVQENLNSLFAEGIDPAKCVRQRTSGSTGIALTVLKDADALNFQSAVSLRQFFECGGRLRDKTVQLRSSASSTFPERTDKPFYEHFGILRTEWLKTDEMPVEQLLLFLASYRPDVMVSYPSSLQLLAERITEKIDPRLIFCTAEVLSDHFRKAISRAFGAHVIDSYGCTEAGDIAWECPEGHEGYHINADSVVVEFVEDGESVAPSEDGEIVVTNLFNYAMPFIRYKIGDVGVPSDEQCSCGRTLPLMRLLRGRSDDYILLPDGRRLPALVFLNMKEFAGVSEFRIVQEEKTLIRVWLKMHLGSGNDHVARCASALGRVFGGNINTVIEVVDEIPEDNSGKLRRVISRITS